MTQTGIVYSRMINGEVYTFGVSGLLYKSNLVMYDHQSESLWSQLLEKAIAGPLAGTELKKIPSERISWETFVDRHPDARVLSRDTGYDRNYSVDPYEGYYQAFGIMFPVGDVRRDLPAKERVMGVTLDGKAKAYPIDALREQPGTLTDTIGEKPVRIRISEKGEVLGVTDPMGNPVSPIFSYWFSWQAFHPETAVYSR